MYIDMKTVHKTMSSTWPCLGTRRGLNLEKLLYSRDWYWVSHKDFFSFSENSKGA